LSGGAARGIVGAVAGLVSFINLGPGDPKLRTERARERLASADVVVHDDEVRIETLFELARAGKHVVRAVRGDVLGSSHVVAEAVALAHAGIAIEVVPGVAAAAAAAAYAGVLGRAVYVRASEVADAVRAEPPDAPVTLIAGASLPSQRVCVTRAADAPDEARAFGDARLLVAFGSPEPALRWFERRPLFGKRVLVTRAREQAGGTAELLREFGAEPWVVPTIDLRPPADPEPLARALRVLRSGGYDWAAFTSANGVERAWEGLLASGGDARAFGGTRLAAIGPATARALELRGLRPDVVSKVFRGEGLASAILEAIAAGPAPVRVLLARARRRDALPEALRAAGHRVDVVAAYETHPAPPETVEAVAAELERGRVDAVLFTSSSTVENLSDRLGGGARAASLLARARVASIGPVTTETAVSLGIRVDLTAESYTVPGLLEALARSYG
jgi:uroporphyrinogen III methyltransferase/synthase